MDRGILCELFGELCVLYPVRVRLLHVQRGVLPQTELCIKKMFSRKESRMNRSILCGLSRSPVTIQPYWVV